MPSPQWGGVVGENDGFEDFPADILGIPSGSSVEIIEPYNINSAFSSTAQYPSEGNYLSQLPDGRFVYAFDVLGKNASSYASQIYFYATINLPFAIGEFSLDGFQFYWAQGGRPDMYGSVNCTFTDNVAYIQAIQNSYVSAGYWNRIMGSIVFSGQQ